MQVHIDAVLLLFQSRFSFAHVVCHAVLGNERVRLALVVDFGRIDEGLLKGLFVDVEVLSVRIRLIDTERDCGSIRKALAAQGQLDENVRASCFLPSESTTFLTNPVSIVSPFLCFSMI
jgi:hypothetical protein